MIKYEKYYLLYCSIDVLDCDCCEKLCGKVSEEEKCIDRELYENLFKKA